MELAISEEDLERWRAIARSRTEPASQVERAQMLLAYRDDPSFFAVGQALGVHHQTVQRCVERAVVCRVTGATAVVSRRAACVDGGAGLTAPWRRADAPGRYPVMAEPREATAPQP